MAVYEDGAIAVREFRRLKQGDLVAVGRAEDGSQGIYVHTAPFARPGEAEAEAFSFRQGRSRETAYSKDYDSLYELLEHEKEHGFVTWVLGPACSFDKDSREAFSKLVAGGYVHALLAGNARARMSTPRNPGRVAITTTSTPSTGCGSTALSPLL